MRLTYFLFYLVCLRRHSVIHIHFLLVFNSTIQRYDKGMTIPNRTVNRPQLWNGKSLPCLALLDNTSPKISVSDCVFEDTCLALLLLVCLAISITIQRYYKGMTIPNRLAVSPQPWTGSNLPCPCPWLAVSPTKKCEHFRTKFGASVCLRRHKSISTGKGCNFPPIKK